MLLMDSDQPESVKGDLPQFEQEATKNNQTEEALKGRLRFEGLLSDLSARFINIAPDQVDLEIQSALRQILDFFQVDRCGLLRIAQNRTT